MNYAVELPLLYPELMVLGTALAVMLIDLWIPASRRGVLHVLAIAGLLLAALLCWRDPQPTAGSANAFAFFGTFNRDVFADVLKVAVLLLTALCLHYSKSYASQREIFGGDYLMLVLFAALGAMIIISAGSLITMYLGIELLALSSYGLIALTRDDPRSSEAAMKYFVLGAIASGVMLYGMSFIYGATGTLDLAALHDELATVTTVDSVLALGIVFVVIGVAFKFAAVPFHVWIPDVYQGTGNGVMIFLSSVPKIASVALAIRLLPGALLPLHEQWAPMLAILVVASLIVGNVVAIAQSSMKRMLAYSTIGHVGFFLLALVPATNSGISAAVFYALVYSLTLAGTFGLLAVLSSKGHEIDALDDLRGLAQTAPWGAAIMLALMASLAGIPGLAGFVAKFVVLRAAIESGHLGLALFALLMSVVGAFYYLRVIKLMYFDEPATSATPTIVGAASRWMLGLNGAAQVLIGIFPNGLLALAITAGTHIAR